MSKLPRARQKLPRCSIGDLSLSRRANQKDNDMGKVIKMKASKKRKVRTLKLESLESRDLMAANLSANLSGGTLRVTGTEGAEFVRVVQIGNNVAVYNGHNTRSPLLSPRPISQLNNLQIQLNGGNDRVEVNLQKALDSIFIDMGRGSNESIDLKAQSVRNLNVTATQSLNTRANLSANVSGVANLQFGDGQDTLQINRSTINELRAGTGRGNDTMVLHSTSVDRAIVNLGEGDDKFQNIWGSQVSQGTIDGGSSGKHGNHWDGPGFQPAVDVKGFVKPPVASR
jgi:hypothetical protein